MASRKSWIAAAVALAGLGTLAGCADAPYYAYDDGYYYRDYPTYGYYGYGPHVAAPSISFGLAYTDRGYRYHRDRWHG